VRGAAQLAEVGASEDCIERFTEWMRGFVAAAEHHG
jgi:hypothetical protein